MKAEKVKQPNPDFSPGLLAVPVARLFDRGIMVRTSGVLEPRMESCQMYLNPEDAEEYGLEDGCQAELIFEDMDYRGRVCLDESVPSNVVLAPRMVGLPITSPENAEIKKLD